MSEPVPAVRLIKNNVCVASTLLFVSLRAADGDADNKQTFKPVDHERMSEVALFLTLLGIQQTCQSFASKHLAGGEFRDIQKRCCATL